MLLEIAILECRKSGEFALPKRWMKFIHPLLERIVESDVERPLPGSFHEAINRELLKPGELSIVHTCAGLRGQLCVITIVTNA